MERKVNIDILEEDIFKLGITVVNKLLFDQTTKKNIIWATADYEKLGVNYSSTSQIKFDLLVLDGTKIVLPRIAKSLQNKIERTKGKAEVFTPSWICNAQNNLVDRDWFEEDAIFNKEVYKSWKTYFGKLIFQNKEKNNWQKYVDARRMEITCGEAPYLVSRYDTVTGFFIPLEERIGLLDRKLRVVNENTEDEVEWYKWTVRAFESIYGFEFHGDSLLLARENLLYTFIDNLKYKFKRLPSERELLQIVNIISWNIWQMDGLKFVVPFGKIEEEAKPQELFDFFESNESVSKTPQVCVIKDWRAKKIVEYRSLLNRGK